MDKYEKPKPSDWLRAGSIELAGAVGRYVCLISSISQLVNQKPESGGKILLYGMGYIFFTAIEKFANTARQAFIYESSISDLEERLREKR